MKPFGAPSPDDHRVHRKVIAEFRSADVDYLNRTVEHAYAGGEQLTGQARARYRELVVDASRSSGVISCLPIGVAYQASVQAGRRRSSSDSATRAARRGGT